MHRKRSGKAHTYMTSRDLTRRTFFFNVSFAATALHLAPLCAQYIEPTTNAEKFMYATVRIVGKNAAGADAGGTGFFYKIKIDETHFTTILITNEHVVHDIVTGANFDVHTRSTLSGPPDGISNIQLDAAQWINHPNPNVDLCAYPIQPSFNQLGTSPFYLALDKPLIPSPTVMNGLDAIEEVVMIGYPVLLYDEHNEYPIIRRGITASDPTTNFDGRPEIALDIAVFPGSSGSPVLIYNAGSYYDKKKGIVIGSRTIFLGVLYN